MKRESQKQFEAERNIIKKALKQLLQKKKEIRIHFLNNNTCQVRKYDLEAHINADIDITDVSLTGKHINGISKEIYNSLASNAEQNRAKSSDRKENLFQVIYRNASRMQSIGWHEQKPIRRTSNMSRTFRKRRRSNIQDYSAINEYNELGDEDCGFKLLKNSRLTINNMQLSGFTNQLILKKSAVSIQHKRSTRNIRQNKYPHILTFIGDKNFKRAQIIPPRQDTFKGIFSIAVKKIDQKWKFQGDSGSKSTRQIINPELSLSRQKQKFHIQKYKHKQMFAAKKSFQTVKHHHDHPFLKQIKPTTQKQTKKVQQKRSYSQFIRSRSKNYQKFQNNNFPNIMIPEQLCRPWSGFPNLDERIAEGKQTLQQPLNQ